MATNEWTVQIHLSITSVEQEKEKSRRKTKHQIWWSYIESVVVTWGIPASSAAAVDPLLSKQQKHLKKLFLWNQQYHLSLWIRHLDTENCDLCLPASMVNSSCTSRKEPAVWYWSERRYHLPTISKGMKTYEVTLVYSPGKAEKPTVKKENAIIT